MRCYGESRDVGMPGEIVLAELEVGGGGFRFAHYCTLLDLIWNGRMGRGCTISVDITIYAFCDVEEVRPLCEVAKVEVKVICLGQRIEVGGVEFEDIHCVEGAQRGHFRGSVRADPLALIAHNIWC